MTADADLSRIEAKLDLILDLLRDPDQARLQALLPRIAQVVGDAEFLLSDLADDLDLSGLTLPRLGKLFERSRNRAIAGYRLIPLAMTRQGRKWRLLPLPLSGAGGTMGPSN